MAGIYEARCHYDHALDMYIQSLEYAKEVGDKDGISRTLNNMAGIHYIKGDSDQALNLYNQSLNMAKELGDQYGMCQTLNNISAIYHNKGEYAYALYYAIQSYEPLKRLNVPEAQRSLDIVFSIRDTLGKEEFYVLEDNAKREMDKFSRQRLQQPD